MGKVVKMEVSNYVGQVQLEYAKETLTRKVGREIADDILSLGSPLFLKELRYNEELLGGHYVLSYYYELEMVDTKVILVLYEAGNLETMKPDTFMDKLLAKFGLYRKKK